MRFDEKHPPIYNRIDYIKLMSTSPNVNIGK